MSDDLISFVIDGSLERNGAIPAEAFLVKLRAFITTLYAFERAYSHKDKRQIDLEIVNLSRNSPAHVAMRVRTRTSAYPAEDAVMWAFDQLGRLYDGQPVDSSIPQSAIDNVVELAHIRDAKIPELGLIKAIYRGCSLNIDHILEVRALEARALKAIDPEKPWRAGVSKGSLFGALRGVLDLDGERQFFIIPPVGPKKVRCIFPEALRISTSENLFKVVRAHGFLHYDGQSPHPFLLEADRLDGMSTEPPTFANLRGAFKGMEMPEAPGEWA